ncbi:MAG: hypothetical protein AAFY88_07485, partial [Acidobacteriota bacterium]
MKAVFGDQVAAELNFLRHRDLDAFRNVEETDQEARTLRSAAAVVRARSVVPGFPLGDAGREGRDSDRLKRGRETFATGVTQWESGYYAPGSNNGGGASQGTRFLIRFF